MVVRHSRCVSYTPRTSAIPKALPSPSSAATAAAAAAAAVAEQPDLLYLSVTGRVWRHTPCLRLSLGARFSVSGSGSAWPWGRQPPQPLAQQAIYRNTEPQWFATLTWFCLGGNSTLSSSELEIMNEIIRISGAEPPADAGTDN